MKILCEFGLFGNNFFLCVFRIRIILYLNNKYYNCLRMTRDMTMGMVFFSLFFFLSFRLVVMLLCDRAVPRCV